MSKSALLRNKWFLATLLVFCWAMATTFSTVYYSFKYTDLLRRLEAVPVHVSVSMDYGNQTTITLEEVYLFSGATALDSLRAVANVTTEYHEIMGLLVTGVDGLSNDWAGAGKGWQYWLNDQYALEAADMQILVSGDVVDWRYTTYQGPG